MRESNNSPVSACHKMIVYCHIRYATLALEKGLLEDAIKVVLRLLVQRSSDAKAKDLLSQCLLVSLLW